MRLIVVSDTHGDKDTLGVSRAAEVERAIDQSVQHALRVNADAWLHLGDLCDPDNGGATLRAQQHAVFTACRLANVGVRSIWLAGNHDACEDGSGMTTLAPLKGLERSGALDGLVIVADEPRLVYVKPDSGIYILCLPFMSVARAYDPAEAALRLMQQAKGHMLEAKGHPVVTISHLMVPGIAPGEETTDMPRGREVTFPLAETRAAVLRLQGHYHQRQVFDPGDGGPPIRVIGSPAAFSFGEHDETGGAFLDVDL